MKTSTNRMLTTHVGSMARPPELFEMLSAQATGRPYDRKAFAKRARSVISDAVRRQADIGIDVVSDMEQGKQSFVTYIGDRLSGFETRPGGAAMGSWAGTRERLAFPEFYDDQAALQGSVIIPPSTIVCTGPIAYRGQDALRNDIENLNAALQGVKAEEAFMTAISPNNVEGMRRNEYYRSEQEFLEAIADAMNAEYKAIVDAGFVLQVDDPRFSTYYNDHPELSMQECRRWAEGRAELVNHALRSIPAEKVRFHTCYSIDIGPRVHDMPLKDIVEVMLKIDAGAYSFEASNPRHEHEYRLWQDVKLPEGKVLIPGVISHTTNLVEHPELIAQRIVRYTNAVGRENVIAGADCGFAAVARTRHDIHPTVAWAKLEALAEGARIATEELWRV